MGGLGLWHHLINWKNNTWMPDFGKSQRCLKYFGRHCSYYGWGKQREKEQDNRINRRLLSYIGRMGTIPRMGWSFDGWTKMRRIIWMVSNNRRVHANPKSKPVLPNIKGKFRTTCRNVHRIIWRKTTHSKKGSNRIPHSALRPPRLPACLVPMCRLRGNLENPNVIGQYQSTGWWFTTTDFSVPIIWTCRKDRFQAIELNISMIRNPFAWVPLWSPVCTRGPLWFRFQTSNFERVFTRNWRLPWTALICRSWIHFVLFCTKKAGLEQQNKVRK